MKEIIKDEKGKVIKVKTINEMPSKTQQHHKDAADVNKIMERYKKKPDPAIFVKSGKGVYADFSEVTDYQSALHQLKSAEAAFMSLPSDIRHKMDNDPSKLIGFLNDPKNEQDCIKMGLIKKPKIKPDGEPELMQTQPEKT